MYSVHYTKQDTTSGVAFCDSFELAESEWERLIDSGECVFVQIEDEGGDIVDSWDLADEPLDLDDEDDFDDEDEDDEDYSEWDDEDWEDEDAQSYHEHEDYFDEIGYDPYQGCVGDDC